MLSFARHEKITLLSLSFLLLIGIGISFYKTNSTEGLFVKSLCLDKEDLQAIDVLIKNNSIININTADLSEFEKLPGIGPSLARRIAEYRDENGSFTSKEDLMQVKGIGPKKFESLKESISLE